MLAEALLDRSFYAQATPQNSLIIADVTYVPVHITHDLKINRRNINSSHEEAVVISHSLRLRCHLMINQCVLPVMTLMFLFCFVLLIHFYNRMCLNLAPMIMASPVQDRAVTDIRATAALHNDIAGDLLVIHGLSGADTLAASHGIGEAMVLKVARKGQFSLGVIGDTEAGMDCHVTSHVIHICCIWEGCRVMQINDRV